MPSLDKLLENGPLVTAASAILLAAFTYFAGGFKWLGSEISKYLEARRQLMSGTLPVPKRTLYLMPLRGGGVWPSLAKHDFGNGHLASSCSADISVTPLVSRSIQVAGVDVRLRGWKHRHRTVHSISFSWSNGQHTIIPRGQPATVWMLSFFVFPEVPASENSVLVDIVVFDQFGNAHAAKKVRFTRRPTDALPWSP